MVDDSIAIDIQNGTFSCDRFSLEGNEGGELILPLKIVNTAGRDLNCIRNFCATAEMQDTSGYAMHFNARSGTLVDACKIGGNIYHVYPIVVINPWFIGAYGLVSSGSTWAKSKSIGGMQLDEATEVATSIDPNMRAAGFIQDVGTVQTTATIFLGGQTGIARWQTNGTHTASTPSYTNTTTDLALGKIIYLIVETVCARRRSYLAALITKYAGLRRYQSTLVRSECSRSCLMEPIG